MNTRTRYVALLRGINVGGHHKVPMAELAQAMRGCRFDNVTTILNSAQAMLFLIFPLLKRKN